VKLYKNELLENAPEEFKSTASKSRPWMEGFSWTVQVAPEDCTGCGLCAQNCPGKDKTDPSRKALMMVPQPPIRERGDEELGFLPDASIHRPATIPLHLVKNSSCSSAV
jgi:pyruvate-ferredoxin/flavodoxin oxidoreductase